MSTQRLPNAHLARIEEQKIKTYVLNLAHKDGGPKAVFFRDRGFNDAEWEAFADALKHHARTNPVVDERPNEFGTLYALDCNCPTPDQRNPCIRTVWEIRPEDPRPRLITAYPLG